MQKQIIIALLAIVLLVTANEIPIAGAGIKPEDTLLPFILIKNGIVTNAENSQVADVLIHGGKIERIGKNLKAPIGARVIDASGKYVMPGGIDPHTHMELPFMGSVSADDFYGGTRAAAAGGTTMIIDFAIPGAGQSHLEAYEAYRKKADAKVCTDYGLHIAVVAWNDQVAKDMEVLVQEKGVNSFKFFMAYKNALMVNDEQMFNGFKKAASLGAISMAHAENGELVVAGQAEMLSLNITGPEGHGLSRPASVEAEATHRASVIAEKANAPLYIVHVMSKDAMEEVIRAKQRGVRIIGEPLIHGLLLDDSKTYDKDWNVAAQYIMSPPLRPANEGHNKALRNALKNKLLDVLGTDHCSFTLKQRANGRNDFTKIPNGLPGVEDRMNLFWDTMVRSGEISPSDFVRITSAKIAQVFNIYPRKGAIVEGADADVIILNPNATKTLSVKNHHYAVDYHIYEGKEIQGIVETTVSGGRIVYENNKSTCERGAGKFVPTPAGGILFEGLEFEKKARAPRPVKRD